MSQQPHSDEAWVYCPSCGEANAEFNPSCQACGQRLPDDSALPELPGHGGGSLDASLAGLPVESMAGGRFSHYRLVELLGRGNMGLVYRAEDQRHGRLAALKTLAVPHLGLLTGLRREIEALSRIRHPGIVRILDHGVADGIPWYAMELLQGRTLRHWQRRVTEPSQSAAGSRWWTQTLAALELDRAAPMKAGDPVESQPDRSFGPESPEPKTREETEPRPSEGQERRNVGISGREAARSVGVELWTQC